MKKTLVIKIWPILFLMAVFIFNNPNNSISQTIQEPEKFFGFKPGTDRMMFNYEKLIAYLQQLDSVSNKMKMIEIGKSPMGKPMYVLFISSEKNISQLDELKAINKRLALEPSIAEPELNQLLDKGRVFLMTALSIHSSEVGTTQAFPLVAYQMLTSSDEQTLSILDNVVYMVVPSQNPDGMDMVNEHYNKYKGTKYERCGMPGVYHKYVGHDNNRDFVSLTQEDVRNVARLYNTEWYPQVLNDKHQMSMDGTRYFVPPYHDPIAENIEAELWNWSGIYGSNLIKDMTSDGLAGVSQHVDFDNYWPGSTETSMWKNVVSFLTEAASTHLASPVFIEPSELSVDGKGLAEYKKSINMPLPWRGGWWRLSDIVAYELSSTKSILSTTSANRVKLLKFRNDLCKKQVNLGNNQSPYYFILPQSQHDKGELLALIKLMQEHGVLVNSLTKSVQLEGKIFEKGDVVISLSQPYRAFIKEVMEKQKYPERHYMPDGELIKPYDITNWSIPLNKGLKSFQIETRSFDLESNLKEIPLGFSYNTEIPENYTYAIFSANTNESYKLAFLAIEKKLNVLRMKEELKIDSNLSIPIGSFIIEKNQQLNEIIKTAGIKPIYLSDKKLPQTMPVKMPRIAFVETWFHDMDAGWARFVLDSYHIPFTVLRPGDFAGNDLAKNFDVLIMPDNSKSILMEGKYKREEGYSIANYPPEYTKGMGEEGFTRIMSFIDNGGIVLAWGESTNLFTGTLSIKHDKLKEEFKLPFENESESFSKSGLYIAGALLQIKPLINHPLTYGMENVANIFYEGNQVFKTKIPNFDMDRRIIATFPDQNTVLSGYGEKSEKLANKPAMVWLNKGKGQFVFYAFSPTNRASTTGVYKLLFNALLLDKIK